jgi:hypothetical protein
VVWDAAGASDFHAPLGRRRAVDAPANRARAGHEAQWLSAASNAPITSNDEGSTAVLVGCAPRFIGIALPAAVAYQSSGARQIDAAHWPGRRDVTLR